MPGTRAFVPLLRPPDDVTAFAADQVILLAAGQSGPDGSTVFTGGGRSGVFRSRHGCAVSVTEAAGRLRVELLADVPVSRVRLRWLGDFGDVRQVLGDHWERAYGDLEWRAEAPERVLPWYLLLARTDGHTDGYGVVVQPGALCFWTADRQGVTLWADVRNGGGPIELGGRALTVCDIVQVRGEDGESAFAVHRRLCAAMSPAPRMPDHPVHGTNDWHFAYGNNSLDVISRLAEFASGCSPDPANRPYCLIDDGWSQGGLGHGPWRGNARFGDMGTVAGRLVDLGTRPGIWYRPLTPLPEHGDRWRLARGGGALDPTVPEVAHGIAEQLQRFAGWGYQLVKHDFTSWDLLGRWGSTMGPWITDDGWHFADRTRTTAEVITDLYRLVRRACGDALVIGCNTFGHLAAGLVDLQRIGDDNSGRSWDRTRRMGLNALAFRAAQHGTFYAVDADVAPITPDLPWRQAAQWLHLLAASGTPAFVSVDPRSRTPEVTAALRDAFTLAAQPQPVAEPLDWMTSRTPARWRVAGREIGYSWVEPGGGWPFGE